MISVACKQPVHNRYFESCRLVCAEGVTDIRSVKVLRMSDA